MLNNLFLLFVLAIPIACISWTVTHEELFKEFREWFEKQEAASTNIFFRKLFYIPTCEYCFSHYVTALIVYYVQYHLLFDGWQGYVMSFFSLVWIANLYMSLFGRLRLEIKKENVEIAKEETTL